MKYLLLNALLACTSCTVSHDDMARLMKQEGITKWRSTGYSPFSCGHDDKVSTGFVGIKNGQNVAGTICGGLLFKNYTIRYR